MRRGGDQWGWGKREMTSVERENGFHKINVARRMGSMRSQIPVGRGIPRLHEINRERKWALEDQRERKWAPWDQWRWDQWGRFYITCQRTDGGHCGLVVLAPAIGWNRLWVRFLAVSDIYPMFIEPTITWVSSGFSGYIWLDTKIVLNKQQTNK